MAKYPHAKKIKKTHRVDPEKNAWQADGQIDR